MYLIKKISSDDVLKWEYKPDPHTVSLKDKGEWFALFVDNVAVSFLCIRKQRNEMYIGEVFTAKQYRRKGYFTALCKYVVDEIYPGLSVSTHALASSKDGFLKCGFQQFAFREFKYGNQWWLRREGKKI